MAPEAVSFCVCAALQEALQEAFGDVLVKCFLAVRASEQKWAQDLGGDIAAMAKELYDRY